MLAKIGWTKPTRQKNPGAASTYNKNYQHLKQQQRNYRNQKNREERI
jgi:hypothetical protein